jgi:hypothetical protein
MTPLFHAVAHLAKHVIQHGIAKVVDRVDERREHDGGGGSAFGRTVGDPPP